MVTLLSIKGLSFELINLLYITTIENQISCIVIKYEYYICILYQSDLFNTTQYVTVRVRNVLNSISSGYITNMITCLSFSLCAALQVFLED